MPAVSTTEHEVVVAGGGPTGMMLAAELTLAGVDVVVVERRADQELESSRAGGLHARTIEVLDQRGIAERFLEAGQPMQVQSFSMIPLDISDFPTRHPYGLALWQKDFERILGGWVDELGVRQLRGREVTGVAQDATGVDVELSGGGPLRARYLVGCDGGRSVVRRAAGIEFPGWEPSRSTLIAEVEVTEEPPKGAHRDAAGVHGLHRLEDGRTVRVVVADPRVQSDDTPTLEDLRAALVAVFGTDFGAHNPTWLSRFTDTTRQAAQYRKGRILLAGDAAHVHYPVGGQGLNIGVQDAVNLGWKLARVVEGSSDERLLDTYQAERYPVAARVLKTTMAQTALIPSEPRIDAVRDALAELLGIDEARRRFAGMMSGLDLHYDLGPGHLLVGRRMPDLDLEAPAGSVRTYGLLHAARPVFLDLSGSGAYDIGPWADRVPTVDAHYGGPWELPVLGTVPAPPAVLVRPDGHVAWAGDRGQQGLVDALGHWFGPAR